MIKIKTRKMLIEIVTSKKWPNFFMHLAGADIAPHTGAEKRPLGGPTTTEDTLPCARARLMLFWLHKYTFFFNRTAKLCWGTGVGWAFGSKFTVCYKQGWGFGCLGWIRIRFWDKVGSRSSFQNMVRSGVIKTPSKIEFFLQYVLAKVMIQ